MSEAERPEGWIEPTAPEQADDEQAEAEEAEQPAEPEPEQPAEGVTNEQMEAILASLDREATRHAREVEKRAGVMFPDLAPCPACTQFPGTPGFVVAALPEPIASARRQAVTEALGAPAAPEFRHDPSRETCDACEGLGMLRTGSRVPAQEALPCSRCNGQGWRQKLQEVQPPAALAPTAPQVFPGVSAAGAPGVTDSWGRPIGHPHYGQPPATVGA